MKFVCAKCGIEFERGYNISRKRANRPQYCSRKCTGGRSTGTADFWSKVSVSGSNECWPWLWHRRKHGYGQYKRNQLAHRVAYRLANGDFDDAMFVCHSCDNPACCNPNHLWLGTQADNVSDMDKKGRGNRQTRRGERSNKAKLTAEQALHIFNSKDSGPLLAARFQISKEAVNLIKRGKNWAHVTGARNEAR